MPTPVCSAIYWAPRDDCLSNPRLGIERELAKEYRSKICDTAHGLQGACPWRLRPCPESIVVAQFGDAEAELRGYAERCASFPSPLLLEEAHIGDPDLRVLLALVERSRGQDCCPVPTALAALALLFWRCSADGRSVACDFGCCQLPAQVLHQEFHPITSHAWFCPLLAGTRPAWTTLKECLGRQARLVDRGEEATDAASPPSRMAGWRMLLSDFTVRQLEQILHQTS